MKIVITGASGFLGWHTRLRIRSLTNHIVTPVGRDNWDELPSAVSTADAVIHIAGVNRGTDEDVETGNVLLADSVARAVEAGNRPLRVVFANSIQHGNGSPYGTGKERAALRLRDAVSSVGGHFVDVRLPNLFGEHGQPAYNSFVATFVDSVIHGRGADIVDRPVNLLHAQSGAQVLLDALDCSDERLDPPGTTVRVQEVYDLLLEFKDNYDAGGFPDLSSAFRINLFNTYRAALFPTRTPIVLGGQEDHRGRFVETVRCRAGESQTSFSTTLPGVTRGEHYHLAKIERFVVIQGQARMSLRKMFSDEVLDFDVSGEHPVAVDMPVGWVHNITNTGSDMLFTQFWSHELFRPEAPDTFHEPVRPAHMQEPS